MLRYTSYLVVLFVFSGLQNLPAQDITGTWEGSLGNNQFIQVNIIQVKDKLCGYTWDYILKQKTSYCKAYFTGYYDSRKKEWVLEGSSFIVDSVQHALMKITLWEKRKGKKRMLIGFEKMKDQLDKNDETLEPGNTLSTILPKLFPKAFARGKSTEDIFLEKTSEMPTAILDSMKDCMNDYLAQKTKAFTPLLIIPNDTVIKTIAQLDVPLVNDTLKLKNDLVIRKTRELTHIITDSKKISLNIYDNAIIDGDTVSIFYNDQLVVSHRRLSENPITIDIDLDEKNNLHKIVLFAENLGSIPPNTALIVVTAGKKRYELFASASLTENSLLLFEYKPD